MDIKRSKNNKIFSHNEANTITALEEGALWRANGNTRFLFKPSNSA